MGFNEAKNVKVIFSPKLYAEPIRATYLLHKAHKGPVSEGAAAGEENTYKSRAMRPTFKKQL